MRHGAGMSSNRSHARVVPSVPGMRSAGIAPQLLTPVRRGALVLTSEWDHLFAEGRLRTLARAALPRQRAGTAVLAHATAAAWHGLPLYRVRSDRIDVIEPVRCTRRDSPDVVRHHVPLKARDTAVVDGARVTTLDRTVYDVIRLTRLETAVAAFDGALRTVAWDAEDNSYDPVSAARFRALVARRVRQGRGARGIRQARFVTGFADGRAQLPGESVSRLWMWQLGIPSPELQRRVELGGGRYALLDFAWPEFGRWAEFDGEVKYTDAEILGGRTAETARADQRERQRAIEWVTGWRCDRWGFDQMASFTAFAAFLRGIGLYAL